MSEPEKQPNFNTTNSQSNSSLSPNTKSGEIDDADLADIKQGISDINDDPNIKIPESFPTPRPSTPDKIYTISQDTDVMDVPEIDKFNSSLEKTIEENQKLEKQEEKENNNSSQSNNQQQLNQTDNKSVNTDDVQRTQNAEPQAGNEMNENNKAGNTGKPNNEDENLEYDEEEEDENENKAAEQKDDYFGPLDENGGEDIQDRENKGHHAGKSDDNIDDDHHNDRLVGVAQGGTIPQANRTSQMNQIYDDQQNELKEAENAKNNKSLSQDRSGDNEEELKNNSVPLNKDSLTKLEKASAQVAKGEDDVNYSSEGALNTKDVEQDYYEDFLDRQEEIDKGNLKEDEGDEDRPDEVGPMKAVGALIDGEEPDGPAHKRNSTEKKNSNQQIKDNLDQDHADGKKVNNNNEVELNSNGQEQSEPQAVDGEDNNKSTNEVGNSNTEDQHDENETENQKDQDQDEVDNIIEIDMPNGDEEKIELDEKEENPEEDNQYKNLKSNPNEQFDEDVDDINTLVGEPENEDEKQQEHQADSKSNGKSTQIPKNIPRSINKLPIYVTYSDSKYLLFPIESSTTKDVKTLIPKYDESIQSISIEDLFGILRSSSNNNKSFKFDIDQEIILNIPQFSNLTITEDNVYCKDLTIADFFDLYLKLCDCTNSKYKDSIPTFLEFKLSDQQRFITNYNNLVEQNDGFEQLEPPTKKRRVE
ncbi:hypothetical protein KGF54_001418 [Candida jiufengensis]|uniref:uncharacterized protein n=1 Tax=Candida jiufengensis TaxID=497108 RepID=UPI0022255C68|nr:uncharacterized protein KGF54_001418 [Candida jiufengensis]KAI5955916.1 hypothetical protein KGF54_001418 [Candida jiufengensis]